MQGGVSIFALTSCDVSQALDDENARGLQRAADPVDASVKNGLKAGGTIHRYVRERVLSRDAYGARVEALPAYETPPVDTTNEDHIGIDGELRPLAVPVTLVAGETAKVEVRVSR